jgi:hypothetical protein
LVIADLPADRRLARCQRRARIEGRRGRIRRPPDRGRQGPGEQQRREDGSTQAHIHRQRIGQMSDRYFQLTK